MAEQALAKTVFVGNIQSSVGCFSSASPRETGIQESVGDSRDPLE